MKLYVIIGIAISALVVGYLLGMGYKSGKCVLCKVFMGTGENNEQLTQKEADKVVDEIVKLGSTLKSGSFEINIGDEERYKVLVEKLQDSGFTFNPLTETADPTNSE